MGISEGLDVIVRTGSQLKANEVFLVLFVVDDSSSIDQMRNTEPVIEGYNSFLKQLQAGADKIRMKTEFLNHPPLDGLQFVSPAEAKTLSRENYKPVGNTPLYHRVMEAVANLNLYAQRLRDQGQVVRTMTLVFSDGGNNVPSPVKVHHVKDLVDAMLASGESIVGACAVSDGRTNFWEVFTSMGIPENWIKVLEGGAEIHETMTDMGTMSFTASQSQADFRTTQTLGFRNSGEKKKP